MKAMDYWMEPITKVANAYQLDPYLVAAVVWCESRGRADAFRHEPRFWLRYMANHPKYRGKGLNPHRVSSSYGLMQIMWVVAEELGFKGEPEELFVPRTNLHFGCQKLVELRGWVEKFQDLPPARRQLAMLAAYNGGTGGNDPREPLRPVNEQYAERVLASYRELNPHYTEPPSLEA